MTFSRPLLSLLLAFGAVVVSDAQATCKRIYNGIQVADGYSAQLPFGRVNLSSSYLQPVGTPLGSVVVSPAAAPGLTSETVLWECDLSDADSIYEVFATNGDDRVGGHWEIGNGSGTTINDGLPGYYATWFPYVGIKLTHLNSGLVYSRYWQQAKITAYDTVGAKIQVKAKHLSMVQADLARVSSLPPTSGSGSNWCGGMATTSGSGVYNYACTQPNGYIQFRGGGIVSDAVGSDSNTNYYFWGQYNGIAFGMRSAATISYTATCVARNVTPVVTFMPITAAELSQGMTRSSDFTIDLECSNTASSGTATNQTALGIQVSQSAYAQAQSLGLVTSGGGVTHLLSNGYGSDSSVATGVGISLQNASNGTAMNFLGWSSTGTGASGGWYPVLAGASSSGSNMSGYTNYSQTITATLSALPGLTVKPGKVNATAYVLVKVQ
ncbi:fimbrial protein [Pseudomonas mucidolens]|uniref:Fimbrial protein n=1 Tax=Pseudomonas mucidolens TaxID=46679 RepID=A0A1H2M8X5_9PSED|nr:fimbrial protein [Pseudomonas mucidolens]SDU89700.1 Fimbrial protein [Pseudomonas mucidolens]SQH34319.1 fimbrial subunit [Pseudomonas mucidolens]